MNLWSTYTDVFSELRERGARQTAANFHRSLGQPTVFAEGKAGVPDTMYRIQHQLRPLFGKPGIREPAFGDHPDFAHLRSTDQREFGAVTTLFMDIEGSTRLGVLYEPAQVFQIKNAIIRCAIETIQAFDGHVHRIMGDAVMAYFRDSLRPDEDPAIDALNCATTLVEFVKCVVLPQLKDSGADHDFGVRIGLDYGPKERVLWASYGYPGMQEVTATSFHVDAAAKLQHAAPRNGIMIGAGLRDYLDLPDTVYSQKVEIRDGERVERPYLRPNYTDREGQPINYRQFLLRQVDYLELLPLPEQGPRLFTVWSTVHHWKHTPSNERLITGTRVVPKEHYLRFDVVLRITPPHGTKVRFRVENHGQDAFAKAGEQRGNHQTDVAVVQRHNGTFGALHWETTTYRGLHYLFISLHDGDSGVLEEMCFAVYIQ